jgi:predicted hotdog family 3-hydroxylacyl-ACP dehydratase
MTTPPVLANADEIRLLIPQKEPFIMVDCLYTCEEKYVVTGFTPLAANIFSSNGVFTEPGLIENMAQSAAAGTGYFYSKNNKDVPVGFIGAIKDCRILKLPATGEKLVTEVNVIAEVLNASVIRCKISCNNEEIASCEMKIFLLKG